MEPVPANALASTVEPASAVEPVAAVEPGRAWLRGAMWVFHLALPLLGLWLLLARPVADLHWEHHPSHFWLIAAVAALNVALAVVVLRAALRHTDGRLFLVACAFTAAAGFLGLHALATPHVLLDRPNEGFALASPVGLLVAAAFALASAADFTPERSAALLRRRHLLLGGLAALLLAWAVDSLLGLPPLSKVPVAADNGRYLRGLAVPGVALYAAAALDYYLVYRRRPAVMLLSVLTAWALLAESMIAMVLSRNWRLSWWEWHLLMAAGFALVAYSAYVQYRREGTAAGLFDSIGAEHTARRIRAEYGEALDRLVQAIEQHTEPGRPDERLASVTAGLSDRFGLTERQVAVLARAAEALAAEREQIRHLDALVAVGREARAVGSEADLLRTALARISAGFGRDEVRIGLVTDGRLVFPPGPGGAPAAGGAAANGAAVAKAGAAKAGADRGGADRVGADKVGVDTVGVDTVGADGAAEQALATRQPVQAADDRWVLPLLVEGKPAGVLAARRIHGRYGERDRPVLASLASLLSVTLENARLYHQLDGLFRSYLSPDVATALIADPAQAALGGAVVEVTALFADLRGFTTFSERATPEQIVELLNRYFAAATRCILAEGGTIVQFVGDALMALFNAPVRQPDHALRAGRAALAMQAAVGSLAGPDSPLFRVGINTGPALVGNIGSDLLRNFNAMGDAVNVAARLESAAQPGEVVMGASTHAAIGPAARVAPLGDLQVKGREQPVRAYRLLAIAQVAGG
jgi:class 3 adenylate cyclase